MKVSTSQGKSSFVGTILGFVPWIIYWVFAGSWSIGAAVIGSLISSLAINGYRWSKGKPKSMDTVSLLYFILMAIVVLVLRSDVILQYGGVLSSIVLASIAWGSLLTGSPFTYEYAKESWDEAFWSNPIFVRTNQIITAVWGVVFTAQVLVKGLGVLYTFGESAQYLLDVIVPQMLLVAAIVFTVWFQNWYPLYAARHEGTSSTGPMSLTGLQLIEGMPQNFDSDAAGDLEAVIQFHLGGKGGGSGYLVIEFGSCMYHFGKSSEATLVIESPVDVWDAISYGQLNGTEMYLSGKYQVHGDLNLLLRMDTLFGSLDSEGSE